MQIKKKEFTSLNNFIIINSLCNFERCLHLTVHKSLIVKFHETAFVAPFF